MAETMEDGRLASPRTWCRFRTERGSLTVELAVLTPILVVFILVSLVFGRYALAREQVVAGARAAAEAAAVAGSAAAAQPAAVAAAAPVLRSDHSCVDPKVTVESESFDPGGVVRVSVSCRVDLSDLAIPGLPGSVSLQAVQSTPIDPFRTVQP